MIPMPSLSADLTGPRHPFQCQACGREAPAGYLLDGKGLTRWRECDQFDRVPPKAAVVVLCPPCAGKLVEPHARLYHQLAMFEPEPGAVPLCVGCRHRDGVTCNSPQAKRNGGPGIALQGCEPVRIHLQRAGPGGRGRRCGWETFYRQWPTGCTGRATA